MSSLGETKSATPKTPATSGTSKDPEIIFFLGAPGSGKGTQCSLLHRIRGYAHFSAGDLIRTERDTVDSEFGKKIADAIREPGTFVPAEITCSLIEKAMKNEKKNSKLFLIDGFPINQENLSVWNSVSRTKIRQVFFLKIPAELSVRRCLGRKRSDDTESILRIRFEKFEEETMPIVKHFENLGLLRTIDATQEPNQVLDDIVKFLPEADE